MKTTLSIAVLALLALGCRGEVAVDSDPEMLTTEDPAVGETTEQVETANEESSPTAPTPTQPETETETAVEIPDFTGEQLVAYMRGISQMLVSRPLTTSEANQIMSGEEEALAPVLRGWASEPGFADNAEFMMQKKLKASGERDGIDFELPGNLVHHVVENDLPWTSILTADYCVDAGGQQIECDTGAPYAAGVLATRAYLAGNASRFNLGRANTMMQVFACRIYPMETALQPYLDRGKLIDMFQADSAEEQTVEEAKGGFGNGNGCYSCHGQFGAHAQLFVKYDESGMYVPDATGLQDPDGELGRSVNGLMTSHMNDPAAAASESSQVFGEQVGNLAEAARVISQSDAFLPCQSRNIIQHAFGLSESAGIANSMLLGIAERAKEMNPEPTYSDLVVAIFTHPRVILSFIGNANEGGNQ